MLGIDSTNLRIENFVQLFLDNVIIEGSQNLTKTFHSPVKEPINPLIRKDRPWEYIPFFTCSNHVVRRDLRDGLFKCWYEDLVDHKCRWPKARQCFAVSKDGLHWEKPELDVHVQDGRRTNAVLGHSGEVGDAHSTYVVEDPFPPDESQRYRALFSHYGDNFARIEAAHSPDGIHWTLYDVSPCFGTLGPHLGDVCTIDYDVHSRCFVTLTRHWYMGVGSFNARNPTVKSFPGLRYPHDFAKRSCRRIFQSYSPDFLHWSEPYLVLTPDDEQDNLDDEFYGMTHAGLDGAHLGFLNVFRRTLNQMDVQLTFSRDRMHWHSLNRGQPWLPFGQPGEWDQGMVTVCSPPIDMGDELFIYYGGCFCHHDYWMWLEREGLDHPERYDPSLVRFGLGLARLRKDGYVSLDAGPVREGVMITRPFLSDGDTLVINARCRAGGYIKVEVVDLFDEVIEGCGADTCDIFTGDSTRYIVAWKGQSKIPSVCGNASDHMGFRFLSGITKNPFRKLRFFMKNAELYSFHLRS